jgi:hypothetical protein
MRRYLAALVGVFAVTSHHSSAPAAELALEFSGTWASATNALSPGAGLSDTGVGVTSGSIVPTAPANFVGTPFSGVFYFDSNATGTGGSILQTYESVDQGVQTSSYTQGDQQISTQSSFSVSFGNYVLTNRSSNTIPDTIQTSAIGSNPNLQLYKAGFHILPSIATSTSNLTNIAGAPIIPLASVGLSPSLAWLPYFPVDDPNGNVELDPDFSPPGANTSGQDTNRWAYFLYTNALEMDFDLLNPASATLALPTAGPIDLSQYSTSQITFQTSDNAIYGVSADDGQSFYMGNLYQDILSVVGNITSAEIVAVPEPSTALLWGGMGMIALLGMGARKWGGTGK